jgi:hypothetical protein
VVGHNAAPDTPAQAECNPEGSSRIQRSGVTNRPGMMAVAVTNASRPQLTGL